MTIDKWHIVDFLKDNQFYLYFYSGPLEFNLLDSEYDNFIHNYYEQFRLVHSCIKKIDTVLDELDEDIIVKCYMTFCNSFYEKVFIGERSPLKAKDAVKILELFDSYNMFNSADKRDLDILCYMLEKKYNKKFIYGSVHLKWSPKNRLAVFMCPASTSQVIYNQIADSCWNFPIEYLIWKN